MNSQAMSINFTMDVTCLPDCQRTDEHKCRQTLDYLDLRMWVDEDGHLQTDLFRKPNQKVQYLLPDSAHPRHCFPGIAKGLMVRVVRICSRQEDRDKRLEELKFMLRSRGYSHQLLEETLTWARGLDRNQLLKKVVRGPGEDRVRYIVTYDPRLPAIPAILSQSWHTMVRRDPRLLRIFQKPPQACYRRGPNLASHLLRAKLPVLTGNTRAATGARLVGVRRCCGTGARQQCRLCPHLGAASSPRGVVTEGKINHTGDTIQIQDNITCTTRSVLYLLSCNRRGCGKQYLGQTGRAAYERYTEHEDSATNQATTTTVGEHFQLPGHTTANMEMIPFEHVRGGRAVREVREKAMIRQYQLAYAGLNRQS